MPEVRLTTPLLGASVCITRFTPARWQLRPPAPQSRPPHDGRTGRRKPGGRAGGASRGSTRRAGGVHDA
eukprot:5838303-Prymnesium_polylepis.1